MLREFSNLMPSALRAWKTFVFGVLISGISAVVLAQNAYAPQGGEYPIAGSLPGDQVFPQISLGTNGGYLGWQGKVTDGGGPGNKAPRLKSHLSGPLWGFFAHRKTAREHQ